MVKKQGKEVNFENRCKIFKLCRDRAIHSNTNIKHFLFLCESYPKFPFRFQTYTYITTDLRRLNIAPHLIAMFLILTSTHYTSGSATLKNLLQ